ncbi:hypothetical protein [Xanthomonas campestris]|uniref:hypothetical protein n=1 Tax=Xanthomonas campestris TaxID=339 RepID=UPI00137A0825|nr:hypothetical protein [Xanthomonas campestris]
MYKLVIHTDAVADLDQIRVHDPASAADILVLIEEFRGDQWVLDRLNEDHFEFRDQDDWILNFSVRRWVAQWNKDRNLWRLKCLTLEDEGYRYRIIYAFLPLKRTYFVLGVFPRQNFNYDSADSRTQRVLDAYRSLCE